MAAAAGAGGDITACCLGVAFSPGTDAVVTVPAPTPAAVVVTTPVAVVGTATWEPCEKEDTL